MTRKICEQITGVNGAATIMYRAGFQDGYNFAKGQIMGSYGEEWGILEERYAIYGMEH